MSADKTAFIADGKKFVLKIAKHFIPTKDLDEINDIDEVLSKHREERREVHHEFGPTNPRDPVPATDANHHPVEGRLILFKPAFAGDRYIDVVRNEGRTLLTIFHHL